MPGSEALFCGGARRAVAVHLVLGRGAASVRRADIRTSVRSEPFEQVFETSVRQCFWVSLSEFPTESDRIFEPNRTEFQPNPDRIGISLSL